MSKLSKASTVIVASLLANKASAHYVYSGNFGHECDSPSSAINGTVVNGTAGVVIAACAANPVAVVALGLGLVSVTALGYGTYRLYKYCKSSRVPSEPAAIAMTAPLVKNASPV